MSLNLNEQEKGMDGNGAIVLRDVSFSYNQGQEILTSVSFSIPSGQWVSIAGGNGSGKSTLARLFNGLLLPDSGVVQTAGLVVEPAHLAAIRRKVGMVFQNPDNQFVGSTVEEDIAFGLESMCLDREEMVERIERYARKLDILPLLGRHPSGLSGGQKQRVALASVLAMKPEILVLDEAASMLDEAARLELLALMRGMHQEGRYTILSITHDAEEIMASERVLALSGGRVIADLSPAALFADRELLSRCRLEAPFGPRLMLELSRLGVSSGGTGSCRELEEWLWSFS